MRSTNVSFCWQSIVGMTPMNGFCWRMTCDSDDYYNLSKYECLFAKIQQRKPLYITFNTGASRTIGGYGGLHHCLIPQPNTF
jgi:hypothetical protein